MESAAAVRQRAEKHFASGYLCAESVVLALAQAQGIESTLLPRMASGLCSGMGQTRGPCGALSGAVLGIGLIHGRDNEQESMQRIYPLTQRLVHEFEQEFGARTCDKLLGCDLGTEEGQAFFKQHELKQKRCTPFVARAAELAAIAIAETNNSQD